MTFEIIIPLVSPTDAIGKTVQSLAAQTDRNFTVRISDNCSTKGTEDIERAVAALQVVGIETQTIRPPGELNRIEHWNWLHYQSSADWLKPLLAGDSLASAYIGKLRAAVIAQPTVRSVVVGNDLGSRYESPFDKNKFPAGRFYSPVEARSLALRRGPHIISPSTMAYDRNAFCAVGGYSASLSRLAPALLGVTLAGTYGVTVLDENLCNCGEDGSGGRRGEFTAVSSLLAYHAWTDNFPFSRSAFAWMWLRKWAFGGFGTAR